MGVLYNRSVLENKVAVFESSTPPDDHIGAFEAQVVARMIPFATGILVVK